MIYFDRAELLAGIKMPLPGINASIGVNWAVFDHNDSRAGLARKAL